MKEKLLTKEQRKNATKTVTVEVKAENGDIEVDAYQGHSLLVMCGQGDGCHLRVMGSSEFLANCIRALSDKYPVEFMDAVAGIGGGNRHRRWQQ